MNKALRVAGFCAGLVLMTGTTAESCARDVAEKAPAVVHQAAIDLGHDDHETLSGPQLQALLNRVNLHENLQEAITQIQQSQVPGEVRKETQKLAVDASEAVILNACAREGLPTAPSPPVDPDPSVTAGVATVLGIAVKTGGGNELSAYAVCQAAVLANSPH